MIRLLFFMAYTGLDSLKGLCIYLFSEAGKIVTMALQKKPGRKNRFVGRKDKSLGSKLFLVAHRIPSRQEHKKRRPCNYLHGLRNFLRTCYSGNPSIDKLYLIRLTRFGRRRFIRIAEYDGIQQLIAFTEFQTVKVLGCYR